MTSARSELVAKWREAAASAPCGKEWRAIALRTEGSLRIHAAIREPDERVALLLEAPLVPANIRHFRMDAEGVNVRTYSRPDERLFRIAVTLEIEELRNVFEVLADDIIETACGPATASEANLQVTLRLEAWQAFLRIRKRRLSRLEHLGLMGELTFLRVLGDAIGFNRAVDVWQGPLHGLRDFQGGGVALEVKSALGPNYLIRVFGNEQLDPQGLSGLLIVRPRFQEDPAGFSLASLVKKVRSDILARAPLALTAFNEKVLRAGYMDGDSEEYLQVTLVDFYGYEVAADFPRIELSSVPAGIVDLSYAIDERALAKFHKDKGEILEFSAKMASALL